MCWKCKKEINLENGIYRSSTCSFCGADLHCCRQCKFYSPGSHYDCREVQAELVKDKERANFCDYFSASNKFSGGTDQSDDKAAKARDAFNALFG